MMNEKKIEEMVRRRSERLLRRSIESNGKMHDLAMKSPPDYDRIEKMLNRWYKRGSVVKYDYNQMMLVIKKRDDDELRKICKCWRDEVREKYKHDDIRELYGDLAVLQKKRCVSLMKGEDAEDLEIVILEKIKELRNLIYEKGLEDIFTEDLLGLDNLEIDASMGEMYDQAMKMMDAGKGIKELTELMDEDFDPAMMDIFMENANVLFESVEDINELVNMFNIDALTPKQREILGQATTAFEDWDELKKEMKKMGLDPTE